MRRLNFYTTFKKGGTKMKKTLSLLTVLFVVAFLGNAFQANALEMSAEQKVFWEREQKNWEIWKNRDIEGFKAASHKDFFFWQYDRTFPESGDIFIKRLFGFDLSSYKLDPVKISISGNLALVLYNYTETIQYGEYSGRVISIYVKQDGKWHLMGGMNASCTDGARCPN